MLPAERAMPMVRGIIFKGELMIKTFLSVTIFAASLMLAPIARADEPHSYLSIQCVPDANYMLVSGFYAYPNAKKHPFNPAQHTNVISIPNQNSAPLTCSFTDAGIVSIAFSRLELKGAEKAGTVSSALYRASRKRSFTVSYPNKKTHAQVFSPFDKDVIIVSGGEVTLCKLSTTCETLKLETP